MSLLRISRIFFFHLILVISLSNFVWAESPAPYVSGEIIVKIKDDSAVKLDLYISKTTLSVNPHQTGFPSLNELNAQNGAVDMAPLFGGLKKKLLDSKISFREHYGAIKKKFPKRALRAQKNFSPPDLSSIYIIRFQNKNIDIAHLCELYKKDANVLYAEPNYLLSLTTTGGGGNGIGDPPSLPNDAYVDPDQDGLWAIGTLSADYEYEDMWGLKAISADYAWTITKGDPNVVVAVSDSGIDYNQPDLKDKIWQNLGEDANHNGYTIVWDGAKMVLDSDDINNIDDDGNGHVDDFMGWNVLGDNNDVMDRDLIGHGTHVAGIIGASSNNSEGIAGVTWNSKLMAVAGGSTIGFGEQTISYAVQNGADIINMSWGTTSYSQSLADTVNYAYGLGVVLVNSAGNDNANVAGFFPAGLPHVISVGAWDHSQRADFSNYGDILDVIAPGTDILSVRANSSNQPKIGDGYVVLEGTSMASPHVSGVAALVLSLDATLSPDLVKAIIQGTAKDVLTPGKDIYSGYGLLDAYNALNFTQSGKTYGWHELLVPEPGTSTALSDSQINFKVDIENASNVTANQIYYRIYSGSAETGTLIEEATIPSLGPMERFHIDRTLTFNPVPFEITIVIDPLSTITEYNKVNNQHVIHVVPFLRGWPQNIGSRVYSSPAVAELDIYYPGLEIVFGADNGKVYAFHTDGTPVTGWPQTTGGAVQSSPAIADIDGNGKLDVVAGSNDGKVYAWNYQGKLLKGWPQTTGGIVKSSPAVADFDLSVKGLEIAVGSMDKNVYVWHTDGTKVTGWPHLMYGPVESSPALADLDNDGVLELVIGSGASVYAWHTDGTNLTGWPQITFGAPVVSAPAVADLDGDGQMEVVAGSDGPYSNRILAWHANGSTYWNKFTSGPMYSSVALADFNNDKKLEAAVGLMSNQIQISSSYNGFVMGGWPQATSGSVISSPAVADIDPSYAGLEFVIGSNEGKVYAFYYDAGLIPGWPQTTGGPVSSSPAIADLDGDGHLEIIVGSDDGKLYVWTTSGTSTDRTPWPKFHHDARNTGAYIKPQIYVPNDFSLIQTAINSVNRDGVQIHVAPGTYAESLDFKGANLSLIADQGSSQTTLQAPAEKYAVNFHMNESRSALLQGFKITGSTPGAVSIASANPTISNNIIQSQTQSSGIGINVSNGKALIKGNTISNWNQGIFVSSPLRYVTTISTNTISGNNDGIVIAGSGAESIDHNLIFGNLNDGINLSGNQRVFLPQMYNNTIVLNGGDGLDVTVQANPSVAGNIISSNGLYGIRLNGTYFKDDNDDTNDPYLAFGYNDFWNNPLGNSATIGTGGDNLFLDPSLDASYHLQSGSPCIDTGFPFFTDPDTTRSDMGFLYYDQSGSGDKGGKYIQNGQNRNNVGALQKNKNIKSISKGKRKTP